MKQTLFTEFDHSTMTPKSNFTEDKNGDEVYLRGCIKPPISDQANKTSCIEQVVISEEYKEHKICYCYENECNGAANFKSVSVFTALGLSSLLYFVTKY